MARKSKRVPLWPARQDPEPWPIVAALGQTMPPNGLPGDVYLAVTHEDGRGELLAISVVDLLTSTNARWAIAPPSWWRSRWPQGGYGVELFRASYGRPVLPEWEMSAVRVGR